MKKDKKKNEKAGVVVYRHVDGDEPIVLVVSARKFKNQWVFPVGSVEKRESLETAAKRECEEESGYLVEIQKKLTPIQITVNGATKRFSFFLATVVGEADQWESDRERQWFPLSRLVKALPVVFQGVAKEAIVHLNYKSS